MSYLERGFWRETKKVKDSSSYIGKDDERITPAVVEINHLLSKVLKFSCIKMLNSALMFFWGCNTDLSFILRFVKGINMHIYGIYFTSLRLPHWCFHISSPH